MNCPSCKVPVDEHLEVGVYDDDGQKICNFTEAHALLAAQRHAAAVSLREMDKSRWFLFRTRVLIEAGALTYVVSGLREFIRQAGIQRPRGSKR